MLIYDTFYDQGVALFSTFDGIHLMWPTTFNYLTNISISTAKQNKKSFNYHAGCEGILRTHYQMMFWPQPKKNASLFLLCLHFHRKVAVFKKFFLFHLQKYYKNILDVLVFLLHWKSLDLLVNPEHLCAVGKIAYLILLNNILFRITSGILIFPYFLFVYFAFIRSFSSFKQTK